MPLASPADRVTVGAAGLQIRHAGGGKPATLMYADRRYWKRHGRRRQAMTTLLENLTKLIGGPRDGAMLRHSLGIELMKAGDPSAAAVRLREALEFDADYSAAWKALGRALTEAGRPKDALHAYRRGIEVATDRGDLQAAKEMQVFARRLEKARRDAAD